MIKNIFFDLDGTIINSYKGIINAFEYSLKYFGIKVENKNKLKQFIGPPLRDTFINYYKFNEEEAELAVSKYREYYTEKGIKENELFEGIKELIIELKSKNKKVIMATAKPKVFTEQILEMHEIKPYFDFISGASLDSSLTQKKDIIKYAIDKMDIQNLNECIMVGDTNQDVIGAKLNNMNSIGVLYGFGTKEELLNAGATYIVNTVSDLRQVLFYKD